MNIFASYNWLKEYLKTDLNPQEFASQVSLKGVGVERIYPQGKQWDNILVGKIDKILPHPNADKLKIVRTDIGGKNLEIVCGGSNLKENMSVAVALEGAKIRWHGEGEPIELKPAEIRGVKSEGMICAASEIGLGEQFPAFDQRAILDLSQFEIKPGTPLAKALNMDDTIFDIEVTTNRPDELCILGIGREAGAILKAPFTPPEIKSIKNVADSSMLKVENKEPDLCWRYQAVVIEGVNVEQSPWWLKQKLMTAGTRSINNVVDITNLILWEMGQPLHAFDYDKLQDRKIIIRKARAGEKILALDGEEYKLKDDNLVIADGKSPAAVAGIMGGEKTGVTEKTRTIVLEAATFEPVSVRRTSRDLNLRSESSNLFEKGLSVQATEYALARATELILELCGGKVASKVFDLQSHKFKPKEVLLEVERANKIIGKELKAEQMADILTRLGFDVNASKEKIKAKAPYWRENDIKIPEDLVEEIARIYGYHNLPSILPDMPIPNQPPEKKFEWEKKIKNFAVASGFFEVMPYTMVGKRELDAFGLKDAIKISNPLSVELEYMRPSILPGFLDIIKNNENNFAQGKIFELSKVYLPEKKGELPKEEARFAGAIWSDNEKGEQFYKIKGFVEELLSRFGVLGCKYEKTKDKNIHPARGYRLSIGDESIGTFGELHPALIAKFGLISRVAIFDFNFETLMPQLKSHITYSPLPDFPAVLRDIAFIVSEDAQYKDIEQEILKTNELIRGIEVFDVYQGKGIPKDKKSIALHISFRSSHKTLKTEEIDKAWEKIVETLKKNFGAEIRM